MEAQLYAAKLISFGKDFPGGDTRTSEAQLHVATGCKDNLLLQGFCRDTVRRDTRRHMHRSKLHL